MSIPKYISRRNFLKGAAVAAVGSGLMLAGCGTGKDSAATAEPGIFSAGTYSATVKGYSSYITVTMTFSASEITGCTIDASGETPDIGGTAAAAIQAAIVEQQTVDATTSATASFTIPAIKKAANNCVAQAQGTAAALNEKTAAAVAAESTSGNPSWLGDAPEVSDADIAETRTTDLLIVGAGNGGLMAAATAADEGMDFIICEQNTVICDNRYWVGAVGTDSMKENGIEVDKGKLLNELVRYASGRCNSNLIKLWIDNSAEMVSFIENISGAKAVIQIADDAPMGGTDYYLTSTWHFLCADEDNPYTSTVAAVEPGFERNTFFADFIREKGHEIQFSMTLVKLVQGDDGTVTGAIFTDESGRFVKIEAKNVILATGGYPGNPQMLQALQPTTVKAVTSKYFYPTDAGLGIKAGLWVGASKDDEGTPMIFDRGLVAPGVNAGLAEDGNGNLAFPGNDNLVLGSQPFLKVNRRGERFLNESCPYDWTNFAAVQQPGGVYAMLMDADYAQDVLDFKQYGCARICVDMVAPGILERYVGGFIESGLIFQADSIEELAEKLGIPADALSATIARYNALCEIGVDEDFGKEAYRMHALDKAPYYGCFLGGNLLTTLDGLRINDKCQVINDNCDVISGLYAVGDCSGSFFSSNYPEYVVGVAVGRTMTEARQAVKNILGK